MMGEVQRAMSSSVSRRKTETTLSNVYKQQLIKKCLDEHCVPLEMRKALSSHTNQLKGLPLLLVNLLQRWDDDQQGDNQEVAPAYPRCSE